MLKRTWPGKRVVFGGTAMSQLYKYLKDKQRIKAFFKLCDAIVIGEGETAICEIADCKGEFSAGAQVTNTITYDRYRDVLTIPQVRYEDLTKLGAPIYDHKWDLYFSPERGINYSPTRGCYWNRCTFCDYGLNTDKPTSPWRERRIEQVIEDLRGAQRTYGVKYVYLAVDVLAPAYTDRLADAVIQSDLDIRWSAEIRLEKVFNQDRARKIAESGAVCLSFGMESGNQRVLDLIDKGTKVAYMGETMKNFANAGVAVQLMAFTGFPTETAAEEQETRQFVRDHADYWSAGGLGQFLLTGTSIIARNPEQFGITIIETKDADIARAITYTGGEGSDKKSSLTEDADASFDDSAAEFPSILGRPWAGGTDTLHSMIYYETYGRNCFKQCTLDHVDASSTPAGRRRSARLHDCARRTARRLERRSHEDFLEPAAARRLPEGAPEHPAEPTYSSFVEWESRVPAVSADTTGRDLLARVADVGGEAGQARVSAAQCRRREEADAPRPACRLQPGSREEAARSLPRHRQAGAAVVRAAGRRPVGELRRGGHGCDCRERRLARRRAHRVRAIAAHPADKSRRRQHLRRPLIVRLQVA